MHNPICKQCGEVEVEISRVCYATPVCYACVPPSPAETTALRRKRGDVEQHLADKSVEESDAHPDV